MHSIPDCPTITVPINQTADKINPKWEKRKKANKKSETKDPKVGKVRNVTVSMHYKAS